LAPSASPEYRLGITLGIAKQHSEYQTRAFAQTNGLGATATAGDQTTEAQQSDGSRSGSHGDGSGEGERAVDVAVTGAAGGGVARDAEGAGAGNGGAVRGRRVTIDDAELNGAGEVREGRQIDHAVRAGGAALSEGELAAGEVIAAVKEVEGRRAS